MLSVYVGEKLQYYERKAPFILRGLAQPGKYKTPQLEEKKDLDYERGSNSDERRRAYFKI